MRSYAEPKRVHWWYRFGLDIPVLCLVEETWPGDIDPCKLT